ncbi:MAG: hypothetical protein ACD_24C00110G0001 [uncultured bacterium]|uniref:tRNA N6-adenosine threonylcarbamoyltransferase n=1 Tax=candidate division WWE3 bacterium RBG_16_37_10 TaxID=1802610 RepID=A0A1F4V4E2_UNCKA|nr:MAG: hypothetical protein ACD_24C00110G0001 [uncultured bacterium]OGC51373.1 MAG: tRNA (adenosine(37)-N6)-threonylcarbamoyltransferase complex transferase subunit TsaD [candidate division WWE3 bacterium RBG_16_37_10]
MLILGIETSCDETAAALVEDGVHEISSVIASSQEIHQATGGIVPEVAARKQVEFIVPVIEQTLKKATDVLGKRDKSIKGYQDVIGKIDAIAVTVGPGLIGSLLIGVEAAKALSVAWNKPLIPVNHLIGHIYGNFLRESSLSFGGDLKPGEEPPTNTNRTVPVGDIAFPAVVLIVSGGHTDLVLMKDHGDFDYLGGTLDDAAGEAFDKTARLLGLGKYLGGPLLSKKAAECTHNSLIGRLPRSKMHDNDYDFSFSGLKTAVVRLVDSLSMGGVPVEVIACEFENAVVDVLVHKTMRAVKDYNVPTLLLAGGVAANIQLRTRLKNECEELGVRFFVPPLRLCSDNAIYIASAAYFNQGDVNRSLSEINADPSLGVMDLR